MPTLKLEIPNSLYEYLSRLASEEEISLEMLATDLLDRGSHEYYSSDKPSSLHVLAISELNESQAGFPRLSDNLKRAVFLVLSLPHGEIPITTLSLLWGILSVPYCRGAVSIASLTESSPLLTALWGSLKSNPHQGLKIPLKFMKSQAVSTATFRQFFSEEKSEWYPREESSVFAKALGESEKELSTASLVEAILSSPDCLAMRFLKQYGLDS